MNVLINSRHFNVKIIDFDYAQDVKLGELSTFYGGTAGYLSPEIVKAVPYSLEKNQVWQLGCVLYELYFLVSAFSGDSSKPENFQTINSNVEMQMQMQMDLAPTAWLPHSLPVMEFLAKMLSKDEKMRPTLAEVAAFDFLESNTKP
jgi:serine/threonine protein kinase